MKGTTCQELADRLPDWVSGRLTETAGALVSAHVSGCDDCSAQADILAALFAARPEAPSGLAQSITAAVGGQARGSWSRPAWVLSAAALLVLAVGTTLMMGAPQLMDEASALGEVTLEESQVWISDDAAVAGAPVLDDLSDEALATLLEELGA